MPKKDGQESIESNSLVKRTSKRLMTSKGRRSQINLTSDIIKAAAISRASSQALVDKSWMQEIWKWADKFGIDEDTIPHDSAALLALEYLFVYDISFLPESIGNLVNLRSLEVSHNELTSLPESIGNLINLTSLHFGTNKLTSLPESIGNLRNLMGLYVSDNELTSLPESIDQKKVNIYQSGV